MSCYENFYFTSSLLFTKSMTDNTFWLLKHFVKSCTESKKHTYWLGETIDCNNLSLWAYYPHRLTNLNFIHQDLPHPSVSTHLSKPSWGSVNATLYQACQLVDYTPDSATRLLHYLHIKLQISWTDQQCSSGHPHKCFKHGNGVIIFNPM